MEEIRTRLNVVVLMVSERTSPAMFRNKISSLNGLMVLVIPAGLILRLATSLLVGRLTSLSVILRVRRVSVVLSSVGISLIRGRVCRGGRVGHFLGLRDGRRSGLSSRLRRLSRDFPF